MKMNRINSLTVIVALCLMVQFQVNAQYQITKSVFGNGGGKPANGNYQMNNTMGQPLIGVAGDAAYNSKSGFWYSSAVPAADTVTWKINLIVADVGNSSETLTLGQAATATDGLDTALGEADLPPTPPTGIFDARFELPVSDPTFSLKDYRNIDQENASWTFQFQPSTAGYPFKISWDRSELPPGNFVIKDKVTGDLVKADMRSVDSVVVTLSAINSLLIEMTKVTWKANLVVADAGNDNVTLTFGQAPEANDGQDLYLGETELPPPPPPGIFDARFELPGATIFSLKDFRSDADKELNWKCRFQPGSGGFPITLSWNPSDLPDKRFNLKDAITGTIINVDMKAQINCTVTNSAINSLIIESTETLVCTVAVATGWNIISVPLKAADMTVVTLFPGATSSAFQFNNGYIPVTTLSNGVGYWLKFNNAQDYPIQGMEVSPKQMPVNAGWNIIGPFESDVPTAQISSEPAGIIQSDFFKFDNGYKSVNILEVGRGYWAKVSQAGILQVQQISGLNKNVVAQNQTKRSQERISQLPSLLFEDSNGQTGVLYLAEQLDGDIGYELPPIPPSGIFDVRFSGDRLVERLNDNELEVLISSAQFPVTLRAKNLGEIGLNVKDALGGIVVNQSLSDEKETVMPRPINKIIIQSAAPAQLPTQYQLSQNYPNPFNPTSVISYALPEGGHVRISIYNILGKKVADLVDEIQPAGYHQVEIDARNYASGIYYYMMKAKGFSAIKKMAIVK
ncbi:T9SS type A sorting domain-containing protein [candidate division KSB1 bacterium]|nr:T9SS type A sorting domain-containing protein [candidate division KSB1 bacterium]